MTDKTRSILILAGVDVDSAKERMMGNEKLMLRMLFKVNNGKNYADLASAFEAKDADQAVQASHTLKGLYGNLSVMPLYGLFTQQTALLRAGDFSAAEAMLPMVKKEMDRFQEAISQAKQAEENS